MSLDPLIISLQNDLLVNILQHAEDIGKWAAHITTQIREIIGVRVVALFEYSPRGEYHLINACPERMKPLFAEEKLQLLVKLAGHLEVPTFARPG